MKSRVLVVLAAAGCAAPPERPNVVYVVSDTHRWGAMSFTQTPAVRTPNLEQLAREGISFNRYYVNHPLCTTYRAMFMTGRWPYQQGLIANHMALADRVDLPEGERHRGTIAWSFKDAGYATGYFGKWHLGGNVAIPGREANRPVSESRNALPFGFDRSIVWWGTNNHRKSRYSIDGGDVVEWQGLSNSTATVEQALAWIAEAEQPFFVVISLNPPHGPFHDAPDDKKALYPDEAALPFHPLDEIRDWETHRDYHALISGLDDDVGLVSRELDELGLADDTILVYTSDHGGMTGIEGIAYGQKRNPHDESSRVPFIVRWPGRIPAGVEVDTLFSTIDVYPTLVSLVGLDGSYVHTLTGFDLSKTMRGEEGGPDPSSVFLMHPSNMNNVGSVHQRIWRAVVTKDYTYAVTNESELALWDNSREYQDENLVADPETLDVRNELWHELAAWMDEAETPYVDNWFAKSPSWEIQSWNREHGLGEENTDRDAGRAFVFDPSASKPN